MIGKELEQQPLQSKFTSTHFVLPNGLDCHWFFANGNVDYLELLGVGGRTFQQIAEKGGEARICTDSREQIYNLANYLENNFKGASVDWGKTTYFEHDLSKARPFERDFPEYGIDRVFPWQETRAQVVKSLMIDSFGNPEKIEKVFGKALADPTNNIYLVQDSTGLFVGTFLLKYISELWSVQLHSVAGQSSDPRVSQVKGKLPILLTKMFEVIDPSARKLTFSASGARRLYEDLGFLKSSREGLVIKAFNLGVDTLG